MKDSKGFMRDESDDEIFGSSPALEQFQDLLHNALVEKGAGGMGIAQVLVDSLNTNSSTKDPRISATNSGPVKSTKESGGD